MIKIIQAIILLAVGALAPLACANPAKIVFLSRAPNFQWH